MSDRYAVVFSHDAWKRQLPGAEEPRGFDSWWAIWECDDAGNPVREVGSDAGEPEDKILVRDFKWVLEELNRAAALSSPPPHDGERPPSRYYDDGFQTGAWLAYRERGMEMHAARERAKWLRETDYRNEIDPCPPDKWVERYGEPPPHDGEVSGAGYARQPGGPTEWPSVPIKHGRNESYQITERPPDPPPQSPPHDGEGKP